MAIEINGKVYRNLQEQVGKNQEDIELLKQRPAMHTEVVEELPEVGEEGIIYLVAKEDASESDIYNEYVWTGEAFEFIGNTSADISNMVTTDTAQDITGVKTINSELKFTDSTGQSTTVNSIKTNQYGGLQILRDDGVAFTIGGSDVRFNSKHMLPANNNTTYSLGSSTAQWKDLYLAGVAKIKSTDTSDTAGVNLTNLNGNTWHINTNRHGALKIAYGSTESSQFQVIGITDSKIECGNCNIKSTGSLTDGTNSVTVAEIAAGLGTPTLTASASGTVVTIDVPQNILPDYIELSVSLSGNPTLVRIYKTMSSSGITYGVNQNCHMNARLGATTPTYIELDFDQDDSVSSPTIAGFTYSHMKDITVTY